MNQKKTCFLKSRFLNYEKYLLFIYSVFATSVKVKASIKSPALTLL